jgi:hypothetical protein
VLVGLLRLRREGGGRFGVGQILWKQVGWRWALVGRYVFLISLMCFLSGHNLAPAFPRC